MNVEEQQNNPEFNTIFSQACNTVNAYEDRGSGILSNLPATLQKLSIDSFNPKNAMTILSPKFSNLEHVDFFQYYGINTDEFKQADSIDALKYLTKLKSFNAVLDPSIHKYNHEGPLSTSVTDLNVRIKGKSSQNDMDIGWLFAKFLSINELCILWSGARLIGYKSATSRICPNLTVLRLEHIVAHPKLLHFICNHAPNLKQLYWALWGKKVQENLPEKIQVELPQPTKVKKSVSYYDIDLTGFSLDCFHLHVDLLENTSAKIENLCLSLKKKGGDQLKFIVPSDYECILPKDCSLFPKSTFSAKTNIKIKYGYTKMISINSNAKIDLSDSKIVLDYSDWYF